MTELYHFGIKGQRWGVRRFQSPDGTLTAAGKARYKAYKKDFKSYDKLNRHVSASQKHLKEEGVMLDRVRDKYLKENKNYEKAMRKSSGFLGLKGAEKADKVAKAQKNMDDAGSEYTKAAGTYGVAKKIAEQDTKALRDHVNKMIRSYGKGSINELKTETVKMGQNKLQKLMQGAPKSVIFNKGRDTEEFIKTGKTLADMPIIGNLYTANYIAKREADLERSRVESSIRGAKRQLGGKNAAKYLNDDYFEGVSSVGGSSKSSSKNAKSTNTGGKTSKPAAAPSGKTNDQKKEADRDKKIAAIDKKLDDLGYVTRKQQKANEKALKKHKKDVKKANEQLRDQLQRNVDLEQKGYKSRGILRTVVGSAAGAAAAAAAGPVAGYAAKEGVKAYAKRKAKKKWQKWLGHSATYRVVRSDELYHHGVKGQRWGIRRYQNPDGTLTDKGKKRKEKLYAKAEKEYEKGINSKYQNKIDPHNSEFQKKLLALKKKEIDEGFNYMENRIKRNVLVGALLGGIPGAAATTFYTAIRYHKQDVARQNLMSNERQLEAARQDAFNRMNRWQREINTQNMYRQMEFNNWQTSNMYINHF